MKTRRKLVTAITAALLVCALSCKKKVTQEQCGQLLDRFAALVVAERVKDATPEVVRAEQARERKEAMGDDNFKNCASEVSTEEFACAMKTQTPEAFIKCLE
jgi:hypothetical protein